MCVRSRIESIDNRDASETWIRMKMGSVEPDILELDEEEVKLILASFFTNQVQDEKGNLDDEKIEMNKDMLNKETFFELLDWVMNLASECGVDVDIMEWKSLRW